MNEQLKLMEAYVKSINFEILDVTTVLNPRTGKDHFLQSKEHPNKLAYFKKTRITAGLFEKDRHFANLGFLHKGNTLFVRFEKFSESTKMVLNKLLNLSYNIYCRVCHTTKNPEALCVNCCAEICIKCIAKITLAKHNIDICPLCNKASGIKTDRKKLIKLLNLLEKDNLNNNIKK